MSHPDILVPREGGYTDPTMLRVIETELTVAENHYFIDRREHSTMLNGGMMLNIGTLFWELPSGGPWDLRIRQSSGKDVFIELPAHPVWRGPMILDIADWQEILFAGTWKGPGLRLRYRTLAGCSRNYPGGP